MDAGPDGLAEPALHFHEFVFLLSLMAYTHIKARKGIVEKLQDLYFSKLNLGKPDLAAAEREMGYEEVFERLHGENSEVSSEGTDEEDEWGESEESEQEQAQPEVVQEVEEGAEGEQKG